MKSVDPIAEARRNWEAHGWSEAAPGMAAVTTIVRVNQILESRIEGVLAPLGVSFARFEILRLLGFTRHGSLPMGKIGERLQVHPASVTSAVKRLERDGLIGREVSPTDNRVVFAELSSKGRVLLARATDLVNEVFNSLGLSRLELDVLVGLLDRFRELAGDEVQHRWKGPETTESLQDEKLTGSTTDVTSITRFGCDGAPSREPSSG